MKRSDEIIGIPTSSNTGRILVGISLIFNVTWAQVKLSEITEVPSNAIGRYQNDLPPKVLMGLAHIPTLSDVDPKDWTYVRDNLDGVWMNLSLTGVGDSKKIISTLKTRDFYFIAPISDVKYDSLGKLQSISVGTGMYDNFKDIVKTPRLVIVNDYVSKLGSDPLRYYGEGYLDATRKTILKDLGKDPFEHRYYLTVRAGHFSSSVYDKTYDPQKTGPLKGRAFSTMQEASAGGGFAYERSALEILSPNNRDTYLQAFNRSRELGAELLWLCPRGQEGEAKEATDALVKAYKWFAENRVFPDKIVIINYSRTAKEGEIPYLSMTPMINPKNPDLPAEGSFTGSMYWAIKQREKALAGGASIQHLRKQIFSGKAAIFLRSELNSIMNRQTSNNFPSKLYSIDGARFQSGQSGLNSTGRINSGIYVTPGN